MGLNMDIKNISLFNDKAKLINIGLVILSLIIAKNIYGSQMAKIKALKDNQNTEIKKNSLIGDIGMLEKKIQAYKQVLYKRDASAVISDISEMANSAQIKITSITPDKDREYAAYGEMSVRLTALAPDYHRIGDFISRLENSSGFYTIESLSMQPTSNRNMDSPDKLSFDMSVTAVIFKD
jgi:Tfp pilus assembly protein PilO